MCLATRLVFLLVISSASVSLARAADVDFPSANDVVSQGGSKTYLDLARTFVPDIQPTAEGFIGKTLSPLRHIGGKAFDNTDIEELGFYDISTVHVNAAGRDLLAVLFDLAQAAKTAQGVAVLALYKTSGEPDLIDAADIGFDQSTYFFDQGVMPVSKSADVILTMSTHFNSSQTYTTHSMMMVRDDKLELIDTAFLFNERLCAVERQQNIRYAANPGAAKPFAPITLVVTITATPTEDTDGCGDAAQAIADKREIRVTYNWDAAANKYLPDSDALQKLSLENQSRF